MEREAKFQGKLFLALAVAILAMIALAPRFVRFIRVDICLDHGGRWDYATDTCDGERASDAKSGH